MPRWNPSMGTQMYAPYHYISKYYAQQRPKRFPFGIDPWLLLKPGIENEKLKGSFFWEKKDDLSSKDNVELVDHLRDPREKDFYQDHTYQNQWLQREMRPKEKRQLEDRYPFFLPHYQLSPWIWYPGDLVEVVVGEFAGQRGTIVSVFAYKNEVTVQNINIQQIVLPATESRPEQVVQREHPIHCNAIKHVDPTTNELCDLRVVSVRDKVTKKIERRRISLSTGVLLPIPEAEFQVEGDPLLDTPVQDAIEETYNEEAEMPIIVQRKLQSMENYFVERMQQSYGFHSKLSQQNFEELRKYQRDVVTRAEEIVLNKLTSPAATENIFDASIFSSTSDTA